MNMCHILMFDFEMMLWSRIVNSTLTLHWMKWDNILLKASSPLKASYKRRDYTRVGAIRNYTRVGAN